MTGTQNHEGIAGTLAAIDYLAGLSCTGGQPANRREALLATWKLVAEYERDLLGRLLDGLAGVEGLKVWGITDPSRQQERVPTVSFTIEGCPSAKIDRHLASRGIFSWSGNFYAQPLSEALGLEPDGAVRVGLLHYNTAGEVDRLVAALQEFVQG
jgi:selenocysteine lyase/cysteine desulfurase